MMKMHSSKLIIKQQQAFLHLFTEKSCSSYQIQIPIQIQINFQTIAIFINRSDSV